MIDCSGKYRTLGGRKVTSLKFRPLTPDGKKKEYPFEGMVDFSDIDGKKKGKRFYYWDEEGTCSLGKGKFDLVEVKEVRHIIFE